MNSLQARGKTYERKGQKHIRGEFQNLGLGISRKGPIFYNSQWIRFADTNGKGCAQPDLYLHLGSRIIVFEFKLSRSAEAEGQLVDLYCPLLYEIYRVPLVAVAAFHNPLNGFVDHGLDTLWDILKLPDWSFSEWHLRL